MFDAVDGLEWNGKFEAHAARKDIHFLYNFIIPYNQLEFVENAVRAKKTADDKVAKIYEWIQLLPIVKRFL